MRVAAFDLVINNADRKGGHTLREGDDKIWAIDHGVCFHTQSKLRTVIWEFAGIDLPADIAADLARLRASLDGDNPAAARLRSLLSEAELRAMGRRIDQLLEAGCFPEPDPHRRPYPWPLV